MGGGASSPEREVLQEFRLDRVHDTGRILGRGSYAIVKELQYHGLKYAGKQIHELLFESASPGERVKMLERFEAECRLLGRLQHPCVVQFIGVYWEKRGSHLPVLVMEFLPGGTLASCLEARGVLPEEVSYCILRDVALGLYYLHGLNPPVVHRDLSANNVLLTNAMRAKISDLGVAKIIDLTPEQMSQRTSTQAPGTPCYMPPEALVSRPKYTSKLDIFSYGILMIHVLYGDWPLPSDLFQADPQKPSQMVPVQEIDRRKQYLQEVGETHPLVRLIRRCLHNNPSMRPKTSEALDYVSSLVPIPPTATKPQPSRQFKEPSSSLSQGELESILSKELLQAEVEQLSTVIALAENLTIHEVRQCTHR